MKTYLIIDNRARLDWNHVTQHLGYPKPICTPNQVAFIFWSMNVSLPYHSYMKTIASTEYEHFLADLNIGTHTFSLVLPKPWPKNTEKWTTCKGYMFGDVLNVVPVFSGV